MKLVALVLLSGCHTLVVARVSAGMTATSAGTVGIAISGELGAGFILDGSPGVDAGEIVSMSFGAEVTAEDFALELAPRVDAVIVGEGELRIGARGGILVRNGDNSQIATELAVVRGHTLASGGMVGIEGRVGPLLGLRRDDVSVDGVHGYLGITYGGKSVGRKHDPLEGLFDGGKR